MIEWIPYDRLVNKEKIGNGEFGSVYSATWLVGIRKIEGIKVNDDNYLYKRSREPNSTVALKTLSGFLKEVS
jgi:hypothetical protein